MSFANAKTTNPSTVVETSVVENSHPITAFSKLIQMGYYDAVKMLIESGHNVNESYGDLTPLMFAARHNRVKIVKLLILNGADLKARSKRWQTALDWAKSSKAHESYAIIKEALEKQKLERKENRKKRRMERRGR
jgi:ankyrin repeat protein